ncbi:FAD-dependent oxidoreductase [Micromonospora ureilytica]|nr:FAD-dependent oxidoreductase [Micromonospora ureilytica]
MRTATAEAVRDATALEPERLIYRRGPGEFLGELSLLTGQLVFLTVRVVTAGTVVRISAPELRRVLAEQVDIADVLIETFRARRELMQFGVQIYAPCAVVGLDVSDELRPVVELEDGTRIETSAVVAATGARYRRLDIARWAEFEQSGCIRYAATELDLRGYESQPVAVVGGANSAGQAALSLAARGCTVHLVVRSADLEAKMSAYLAGRIYAHPQIHVHTRSTLRDLQGDDTLAAIVVTSEGQRFPCLRGRRHPLRLHQAGGDRRR